MTDTIAAVSTPRGKGGVALLRVSGEDALRIADAVFLPKNGNRLSGAEPRRAIYGRILDETGAVIDDGLATVFRAPASFTGEDTVEICCHGGILLTETVLTALLAAGARPAGAGEFTKRAFLNGKLDLSAAEALGNLLEAQTRSQLTLAHTGMRGKTGARCRELYEALRRILASVYVTIDYPDEDLADMSRDEIAAAFADCAKSLRALADTYRTGHAVAEGIRTVICGKPNVGKSSLFNRLVGRDAAIVTDVEGTTRDVLTATASAGRVTLNLADTAGLHETADRVEQIGVERARDELAQAELILAVFDGTGEPDENDRNLIGVLQEQPGTVIAVCNKTEGRGCTVPPAWEGLFPHTVAVSAGTGEGMPALCGLIEQLFTDGTIDLSEDAVLTGARQHAATLRALAAVTDAADALAAGYPIDACCTDAEHAMAALAEIDGRAVSEDIVGEIFSHFCVGK